MNHVICNAIASRRLLRLSYSGWNRVVEPHTYGLGRGRHEVVRAWQVEDCVSFDRRLGWNLDPAGWKLLRVDEIRLLELLPDPIPEPRPGYRRGDKDIWLMYCQL
jgi:hypothetical protein